MLICVRDPYDLDGDPFLIFSKDPLQLIRDPDPWLVIPPRNHGSLVSALI